MIELGSGWAPAVIDDSEEFDFIQHQERMSTDDRSYWIGDMTYDTLESKGYSPGITDSIFQIKPILEITNWYYII